MSQSNIMTIPCSFGTKYVTKYHNYYGNNVYIHIMDTGEHLHPLQFQDNITSLSFTTDNTQLWMGDEKGVVHVCDVTSGKVLEQKVLGQNMS